jgi:hypothetical protein
MDEDFEEPLPLCGPCGDVLDIACENCGHCGNCCDCGVCPGGYRTESHTVDSVCSNCGCCDEHCGCYVCNGCGERCSSVCGECERCEDCGCNCENYDDAPRWRGHFSYLGEPTKTMPRYTSLELEYDGCEDGHYVIDACRQWSDFCVEDGSLGDEGFEINTNPSRGIEFGNHIRSIVQACRNADSCHSDGCGLHVHVDARDLNWHDINKLALLYQRVEPAMFGLQPRSRWDNHYCLWVRDHYAVRPRDFKHAFLRRMYRDENRFPRNKKETRGYVQSKGGKLVFSQRAEKYHSNRYYAMNLHTWFYRGTVEFRHAASTLNATKAVNWGLVCMWLVEKASTMTYGQITSLPLTDNKVVALNTLTAILPVELGQWVTTRYEELRRI